MQKPHSIPFLPQFNNGDWITDPSQMVPTGGVEEPGDIYLEWHADDGAISMSGFGDCMPGDPYLYHGQTQNVAVEHLTHLTLLL